MQEYWQCFDCEGFYYERVMVDSTFQYKGKGYDVELTARVPVWRCLDCAAETTRDDARLIRQKVVEKFLKDSTPKTEPTAEMMSLLFKLYR